MRVAEWLDIYDENLSPIGVKEREAVHRDGDWHKTFDAWLVHPSGSVLFQQRGRNKRDNPLFFDTSSAGHYQRGETAREGVREIKEELGLTVSVSDLLPMGIRTNTSRANGRIDNEFQELFMVRFDGDPRAIDPDPDEVEGAVWIPIADGLRLFGGHVPAITVPRIGLGLDAPIPLSPIDFVPAKDRYYLKVFWMAARMLRGERDLAV